MHPSCQLCLPQEMVSFPFPLSGFPCVRLPARGPAPGASVWGLTLGMIHSGKPPICSLSGCGPRDVPVEEGDRVGKGGSWQQAPLLLETEIAFWPLLRPPLSSRAPIRASTQGPGLTVSVPGKGQSSASPVRHGSSASHLACLHCSHSSCPRLHSGLSSLLSSPCSGLCASFSDRSGLCPEAGGATGLADWGRAETQLLSHGTGSSISSGVYSCAHPVFVEVVQKRSSHGPCLLRVSVLQEK